MAGGIAGTGAAALAYGSLIERNLFGVREETVRVLPAGSDPLRILHLSDIHFVPGQDRKVRWLQGLADLEPDLVVNTGDNLSHPQAVPAVLEALKPVMRFPGVFVPGSNDYYAPVLKNPFTYFTGPSKHRRDPEKLPWGTLFGAFEDAGWLNLTNTSTVMDLPDLRLNFSGVDDPHLQRDRYQGFAPSGADTAGDRAARGTGAAPEVKIGVAHAPYQRVLNQFTGGGAEIILAGHTHGGQVCIPGYGALVSNCDLPTRQARGLTSWAHAGRRVPLNVSAGIGTSRFAPVRFACRPEAVLLTLTARDS
ncbi:metallophosphoesterase [Arthrobacter sp. zg-Y769]|nr:metallophosphoesterase [Arthrobacter sp. zg-Y769]MCC9204011.1 metallophosphoesterase [Arthrobacter sp. zg-Y769]